MRHASTSPQSTEVTPSHPEHTLTPARHHHLGGRHGCFDTPKDHQPLCDVPPHHLQPTSVDTRHYGTARPGAASTALHEAEDDSPVPPLLRSSMRELRLDLQQRRRSREQAPQKDALTVPLRTCNTDVPRLEEDMMPPFSSECDTESIGHPVNAAEIGSFIPPRQRQHPRQQGAAHLQLARLSPPRQQDACATAASLSQQPQLQAQPRVATDQQQQQQHSTVQGTRQREDASPSTAAGAGRAPQLPTLPRAVERQPPGTKFVDPSKGTKRRGGGAAAATGALRPLQDSKGGFEDGGMKTPPKRLSGLQRMGCGAEPAGASQRFSELFHMHGSSAQIIGSNVSDWW